MYINNPKPFFLGSTTLQAQASFLFFVKDQPELWLAHSNKKTSTSWQILRHFRPIVLLDGQSLRSLVYRMFVLKRFFPDTPPCMF